MEDLYARAQALKDDLVADRRWLHEHPEIGFDLPQTRAYVQRRLAEEGIQTDEVAGGVVGLIGSPDAGPCFMLRADMDALPMAEQTGLPFAATNGCMHACGHDGHTAMLIAAARLLKEREDDLPGCVKIMFQADEEGTAPGEICGNEAMIRAGVLENPPVVAASAVHLVPVDFARGEIATRKGCAFSSIDDIDIAVRGRGGHGSQPWQTVDPIPIACRILLGIQNLAARETDTADAAVITFGRIEGGSAANIIPDSVHMLGTLRTVAEETRRHLQQRIAEIAENIARAFGGEADVRFLRGVPPVHNDPALTEELASYASALIGRPITELEAPVAGSDDMSVISQAVPTTYFLLGCGTPAEGVTHPVHSPHAVFDESVLAEGAALLATVAFQWLAARNTHPSR